MLNEIKSTIRLVLLCIPLISVGCSKQGSGHYIGSPRIFGYDKPYVHSYFRKFGTDAMQERIDWGLCGGNYLPDGRIVLGVGHKDLVCMNQKGYKTFNEYYKLDKIDFVPLDKSSREWTNQDALSCGALNSRVSCGRIYVPSGELSSFSNCMSRMGFEPTLARRNSGIVFTANDEIFAKNCGGLVIN